MRPTPLYLLMLASSSSCAEPPLEPAFEIAFDGSRTDGRLVEGSATLTFHAEPIPDRDAASVTIDLGDRRLDVVLDRTGALLTEDAHGAMFTAGDRELMLGLRDHLFAADAAVIESMPGLLLAKTADRYAEVPLGETRVRLDTRLDAPQQEGKADLAPGACGDDGVHCLDGTYGSSWTAFAKNDLCESYLAPYGDSSCRGRCGLGCSWFDEDYTWDCHDHDICLDKGGNCSDEFADAADDWAATSAPYCWSGSNRPKPTPPPNGSGPIVSVHSGKCADVWDWRQDNGAGVQQYSCHGGGNQSWRFVPQADGTVHIVATHSGKCLEVANVSVDNGGLMQQWDCGGGDGVPQQKWTVKPQGNAIALINKLSGKCLDIPGWSTGDSVQLQQYDCHFGGNQLWYH